MHNAGQQYGQGGASSHQGAPYGHTDSSSNNGSITSSLRQFRKKDVEKQQTNDTNTSIPDSHVARVAPHTHYPHRSNECYRYPTQYSDYSLSPQVKYSEISDPQPQEQIPPSVIQKAKGKDYMDMCNVQQNHMKQPYSDHLNGQQPYPPEPNLHVHTQYLQKDPQVHPPYKPESQYFPKDPHYQQQPQQIQKYNMPAQIRKYPTENDFLSKLRRIHPSMARSIMSDHHLQESQASYQSMEQNQMYPPQNQRYMNYSSPLQNNPYPHNYIPPQHYSNYPSSCSYTRSQMGPRFPPINPHERSISPRRGYADNLPMQNINYTTLPQKISPNYSQYNAPEYSQHYQHRRPPLPPQDYYQQHCRTAQYLPHQMVAQEMSENRVTVSDSIKQYIENWADEETASEMNQLENNRLCKENLRIRDDQSTETVYMINASELQYLENGIPLVTSENGIPLVASENGQYIIKSGVALDNSTAMVRIVDKTSQVEPVGNTEDRIVNLHIMDPLKPDCMMTSKPNEINQRSSDNEKPRVVIHQNTVIQPGVEKCNVEIPQNPKIGNSLPLLTDGDGAATVAREKFEENIFKGCKKETVDKNCSPINVEMMEHAQTSVICPARPQESDEEKKDEQSEDSDIDSKLKNMPIIELLTEELCDTFADHPVKDENIPIDEETKDNGEIELRQKGDARNYAKQNQLTADIETKNEEAKKDIRADLKKEDVCPPDKKSKIDGIRHNTTDGIEKVVTKKEATQSDNAERSPIPAEDDAKDEIRPKIEFAENILKEEEKKDINNDDEEQTDKQGSSSKDSEINPIESNKDVAIQEELVKEDNNEMKSSDNLENSTKEKPNNSRPINLPAGKTVKTNSKRSRRIFSVDDIINSIGNNINKSKSNKDLLERRRSLQLCRDFLENEVEKSYILKEKKSNEMKFKNKEGNEINSKASDDTAGKEKAATNTNEAKVTKIEEIRGKSEERNIEKCADSSSDDVKTCADSIRQRNEEKEAPTQTDGLLAENQESIYQDDSSDVPPEVTKMCTNADEEKPEEPESLSKHIIPETIAQSEVQYRHAIRVEENSVLLEIAGELVEINVNNVNGKKIITVIPLSDSAVVDFNDNYESLESIQAHEEVKPDLVDTELVSIEEVIPEPDVIETTSEIIIGMDISLEEEIQLDLEKPQLLCTKAAKKAYENDLQIPSITTSEDINDNNKTDNYSVNDKVSSSKEQRHRKENSEKKKDAEGNLNRSKKIKKIKLDQKETVEKEEFVPFKDLVKARKLKKLKLQQMKGTENVSADSTNRIDQENGELGSKLKKFDSMKEPVKKKSVETKDTIIVNAIERKLKQIKTTDHSERNNIGKDDNVEHKQCRRNAKDDINKVNSSTGDKKDIVEKDKEKPPKRVTFGSVDYKEPEKIGVRRLEDPRIRTKPICGVVVPSVLAILKENEGLEGSKKKLSLEEYINRKRKLSSNGDVEPKKAAPEENFSVPGVDDGRGFVEKRMNRIKMPRPKSLDDLKTLAKPKGVILAKRKLSLEVTSSKPNYFDWEETQSPKTNLNSQEADNRLSEFSGLINNNKSKIVIDINDLKVQPAASENSGDEILQNYKEQVDSKLNSLNIQIPRPVKLSNNVLNPFSNPETNNLMQRFLKNEKITYEEMERVKKIISYKRLVQQLNKIKPPDLAAPPLNPSYEIRKTCTQRDMTLHLKKMPDRQKKKRFRNLYSESTSASDSDFSDPKKTSNSGDYSVVQSTCFAAGVPKLIIKRKTEMPLPVVRLERLDLGVLVGKKRKLF